MDQGQMAAFTPIQFTFRRLKAQFERNPFPDYPSRFIQLQTLREAILEEQEALIHSLSEDYGHRTSFDTLICDLLPALRHLDYTLRHLKKWMKPSPRYSGLLLFPSRVRVCYQPLGVVGVIVPWNFPLVLSLAPVITALAAGNTVMIKLSEHTPATNRGLKRIFASLDETTEVVEGDADVGRLFSALLFAHLLFTGSTEVGIQVARQAAENLTPVTLELGGKSPVIVAQDADIQAAVNAVMLGKTVNSGQICVAPDHVYLPEDKTELFIDRYLQTFCQRFCGANGQYDVTAIINARQYERLCQLLDDARQKGAAVYTPAESPRLSERQMLPHLLSGVRPDMRVMQEEIFGPLLPVIGYTSLDDLLIEINRRPRPRALYLMTGQASVVEKVSTHTFSGGLCVNDTLLHVAADDAPFGGLGSSGVGHYHGIEGFQTFSHARTVVTSWQRWPRSALLLRYRKKARQWLSRWLLR